VARAEREGLPRVAGRAREDERKLDSLPARLELRNAAASKGLFFEIAPASSRTKHFGAVEIEFGARELRSVSARHARRRRSHRPRARAICGG